jgi:hypothetical protein
MACPRPAARVRLAAASPPPMKCVPVPGRTRFVPPKRLRRRFPEARGQPGRAYPDGNRCRAMATSLGFEGHIARVEGDAMTGCQPPSRCSGGIKELAACSSPSTTSIRSERDLLKACLLSAVAYVRAVPAHVTDHDFSRSDRAARAENLNGERGVGIRPHPKCGILHNPTPRWAFVACVVVARRQVAPPRRTVRVVLPPGGELLPQERNSVVIGRAIVPGFLKRAVTCENCIGWEIDVGQRGMRSRLEFDCRCRLGRRYWRCRWRRCRYVPRACGDGRDGEQPRHLVAHVRHFGLGATMARMY